MEMSTTALGDEVRHSMDKAYESYRELQHYTGDAASFIDSRNESPIRTLLKKLHDSFHNVEKLGSRYHDEPGFKTSLQLMADNLSDASKRFNEGKREYSYWRLRQISQRCTTCHSTYNVSLKFKDDDLKNFNSLQKADFYLATRQIEKAETALITASRDAQSHNSSMDIARKFLLLYVRIKKDPSEALKKLEAVLPKLALGLDDKEEVNNWMRSLKDWSDGSEEEEVSLSVAEALIRKAMDVDSSLSNEKDAVTLLRATLVLHEALRRKTLPSSERSEALYLLGFAYSKLSLFFIDEFPQIYLEECIEEFPGTENAIRAFKLYRDIIMSDYTGSGGPHIPGDVAVKMMELRDKAYGTLTIGVKGTRERNFVEK